MFFPDQFGSRSSSSAQPIEDAGAGATLHVDSQYNIKPDIAAVLDEIEADAVADQVQTRSSASGNPAELPVPEVRSVTFAVAAELTRVEESSGIEVFVADDGDRAQYVIPTALRMQIMTVVASRPVSDVISIPISTDSGAATPVVQDDGSVKVLDADGIPVGMIAPPWAKDAAGTSVPTSFEVVEGVLVQRVDYGAPGVVFPVVLDPNWTYDMIWDIGPANKIDAVKVRAEFYECFKCVFAATLP